MTHEIAIVIRKNGERFIPEWPVTLKEGDRLIIATESMSAQVPEGKGNVWIVHGFTSNGPVIMEVT